MTADFRLDDLYNVFATVELPGDDKVIVRVLTKTETEIRDEATIAAYKKAEDDLRGDEEYFGKLVTPLKDEADKETLIGIIVAMQTYSLGLAAIKKYPLRFLPYPDDATPEEMAEVMRKQDEHEEMVASRRQDEVDKRKAQLEEKLQERDKEKLVEQAINALVTSKGELARQEEYQVQTVYMSARRGDTKGEPYWDLEVVRAHGTEGGIGEKVYDRVLSTYFQLDAVDPWDLQKKH